MYVNPLDRTTTDILHKLRRIISKRYIEINLNFKLFQYERDR